MNERINDKIVEIEEFLDFLSKRIPKTLEEYKKDLEKKAFCERYAEKIIEAVVDLAFLIAKYINLEIPAQSSDYDIFDILAEKGIITKELANKLKEAKGMRNIIAHEYGKINDEIVYEAISEQLIEDIGEFIKSTSRAIK